MASAVGVAVTAGAAMRLAGVTKRYVADAAPALDRLTLDVAPGELLFLLGPSGSGKSTALRLIGGYERADGGTIAIGGAPLDGVPAHRRNVGMVFQDYALFPHMTVAQNVAFGLRMRGVPKAEREARVAWALELVRLRGLEHRRPAELSGGQQQRAAIARAIAFGPAVLLLDEPLANLDRHLRGEMRLELKALQRRLGLTTIFVTHDQEEALALADRIAVLDGGRLAQVGAPEAVYARPGTGFVARFMGEMNLLPARLGAPVPGATDGRRLAAVCGQTIEVRPPDGATAGEEITACLRAEQLRLVSELPEAGRGTGAGTVEDTDATSEVTARAGTEAEDVSQKRQRNGGVLRQTQDERMGHTQDGRKGQDPDERVSVRQGDAAWPGTIRVTTYLGPSALSLVELDGGPNVRVLEPAGGALPVGHPGDRVRVVWRGIAHSLRGAEAVTHPPPGLTARGGPAVPQGLGAPEGAA